MDNSTYYIGKITSTHKLAGSVKVSTKFMDLVSLVDKNVLISKGTDIKVLKIEKIENANKSRAIFTFSNVDNIDDAKKIVGYNIDIRKDLIPDYEEEKSIVGYQVYENSCNIGQVIDILETAAHDILIVEGEKEIMIPFIDIFVKEIDDEKEQIKVELIEGMR